jgi:hypothetical protein
MPVGKARLILAEGAGSQWDSEVVEALFNLLEQNPSSIPIYRRPADQDRVARDPTGATAA